MNCGMWNTECGLISGRDESRLYGNCVVRRGAIYCALFLMVLHNAFAQVTTNVITEDIRDIRGPVHIPNPWLWIIYAVCGLAAVFFLFRAYHAWRNRAPIRVKPPHEIALERLQYALTLMTSDRAREFSIVVSDAIRLYIEDRFQMRAARRTTEEFLHDLLSNPSSPLTVHSTSLEDFLRHCDLAKFARWTLSTPDMQSMCESARTLIEQTKPDEKNTDKSEPSHRKV